MDADLVGAKVSLFSNIILVLKSLENLNYFFIRIHSVFRSKKSQLFDP
jgi:hypothetical protein